MELINPSDMHLTLTVFEKDLGKLSRGQKAITYSIIILKKI
jgi:cobalt-zinc-cadmium efflux system membrane fusion protein